MVSDRTQVSRCFGWCESLTPLYRQSLGAVSWTSRHKDHKSGGRESSMTTFNSPTFLANTTAIKNTFMERCREQDASGSISPLVTADKTRFKFQVGMGFATERKSLIQWFSTHGPRVACGSISTHLQPKWHPESHTGNIYYVVAAHIIDSWICGPQR